MMKMNPEIYEILACIDHLMRTLKSNTLKNKHIADKILKLQKKLEVIIDINECKDET